MCLAIPGKVIEISDENGMLMGKISYDTTVNKVCLAYVPSIKLGDYALVHAGFAISILAEDEAKKTLSLWREIAIAEEQDDTI